MALNIKDPGTDRLVRELAAETGESITTAVAVAARERLERLRGAAPHERRRDEILRLVAGSPPLPIRDGRSPEAIIGYDDRGLPS